MTAKVLSQFISIYVDYKLLVGLTYTNKNWRYMMNLGAKLTKNHKKILCIKKKKKLMYFNYFRITQIQASCRDHSVSHNIALEYCSIFGL